MRRTTTTLFTTALLLGGLAACGSDDDDGGATAADDADTATTAPETSETSAAPAGDDAPEVDIVDFAFAPEEVVVAAGTTVTWTNQDDATHSVAVSALDEESDDLAQGDTFEITFDEAGEYPYLCGIHNNMVGTVTVE